MKATIRQAQGLTPNLSINPLPSLEYHRKTYNSQAKPANRNIR